MKCIFIIAVLLVTAMSVLSCGLGSKATSSGPGDPKLTYDLVMQNVDAYKGKRVRWYGRRVSFETTNGVTRATFMNVGKWQAGGDMDPFVVQYRSEKEYSETPEEGWVTGTIEGTHTVGITLGSPSGRETNTPRSVPLLSYPEIEKSGSQSR